MYLYDNNYISELVKRDKNPNVVAFFNYVQANQLKGYLSIITIGEIEFGIEKLNNRNDFLQAQRLRNWYNNNLPLIAERSLVFDEQCAKVWGNLIAKIPTTLLINSFVLLLLYLIWFWSLAISNILRILV